MASWQNIKHEPSSINGGNQYEEKDRVSKEQLNAITENAFYAVEKADEALEKANSSFESNGTVISVGGVQRTTMDFDSDPQTQLNNLNIDKANKDLTNVTYPENVADGVSKTGAGDRVVETYISSDGKTWYRKWASGWKECGVTVDTPNSELMTVTLPVTFTNTSYTVMRTNKSDSEEKPTYRGVGLGERTVNTVNIRVSSYNAFTSLYCCGY